MEKIIISGNLTDTAVTRNVNGTTVSNFSVAVNKSYKNKEGKRVKKTKFFTCELWNRESIGQYLLKGKEVTVEGTVEAQAYIKDGKAVGKIVITVDNVELGQSKRLAEGSTNPAVENTEDSSF